MSIHPSVQRLRTFLVQGVSGRLVLPARVWQWLARVAWAGAILLVLALGLIQWVVFPRLVAHKGEIEAEVSAVLGQAVRIGRLTPHWRGIHPGVVLDDLALAGPDGQDSLHLQQVAVFLAWKSVWSGLWMGQPEFDLLLVEAPVLHVRRDARGQVRVAGFETEGESDPRALNWLFGQRRIRVQHATIVWEDQLRKAPPLTLNDLNLALDNQGQTHRFGLTATPPAKLASRIDLRGEWQGPLDFALAGAESAGAAVDASLLAQGNGRLFAELASADLAAWRAWVDYPLPLPRGRGGVRVWADHQQGQSDVTVDLGLADVRIRLSANAPELEVTRLQGRLKWGQGRDGQTRLGAERLQLTTRHGVALAPMSFQAAWTPRSTGEEQGYAIDFSADRLDMGRLRQLTGYFPLPQSLRGVLDAYAPGGVLKNIDSQWLVLGERVPEYRLKADLEDVGLESADIWPGVRHLSGRINGDHTGGTLEVDAKGFELNWPHIFPDATQQLSRLQGRSTWKREGARWALSLSDITFDSPEASGTVQGSYRYDPEGAQEIDVQGRLTQGDARAVWRFLPGVVGENVRQWLKLALRGGTVSEGEVALKGDLRRFPFRTAEDGLFRVAVKVQDGQLQYDPHWPDITHIQGQLVFEQLGMKIHADAARTAQVLLGPVDVTLPDLGAAEPQLQIAGQGQGDTGHFLAFLEHTPITGWIGHATRGMQGQGEGRVQLVLTLPLAHLADARVDGTFQMLNNEVRPLSFLPAVQQVSGRVHFTERQFDIPALDGRWLGQPVRVQGGDGPTGTRVVATGSFNVHEFQSSLPAESSLQPVFDGLSGSTAWRADIEIPAKPAAGTGPGLRWQVSSDLAGVTSSLPGPLNKPAGRKLHFTLAATPLPVPRVPKGRPQPPLREQWLLRAEKAVNAQWLFHDSARGFVFERGTLVLGPAQARLPDSGLLLALKWPELRLEDWQPLLGNNSSSGVGQQAAEDFLPPPSRFSIETDHLSALGRQFERLNAQGLAIPGGWQMQVEAPEAQGQIRWLSAGKGSVQADLRRLRLVSGHAAEGADVADTLGSAQNTLPSLDIRVADLVLDGTAIGRLELKADNDGGVWKIPLVRIANPDATLSGQMTWQPGSRAGKTVVPESTDLTFKLSTEDAGHLLDRVGYPGMVRRGAGELSGHLSWPGRPSRLVTGSLNGDLRINLKDGQFAKIEAGAGKLLGLLSLQALPRRFLLDFKDVFSDGFAFDKIEGDMVLQGGILRTREPLKVDGPAAQVLMQGDVNLQDETQRLLVTIRPGLSGVASLGTAMAVNPVVGLTTLLAQKLLQNPLDKVFSYQYKVTGSWSEPQVSKPD